jgi:predicted acylesterase/phospholipase RssA
MAARTDSSEFGPCSKAGCVDDPTSAKFLQSLKQEILDEIGTHQRFLALRSANPALVLSGGGAKGAYEAGVVLALFDCGIDKYSTIGGTSVGALNAALCQQLVRKNCRNLVLRIWSGLTFSKVLKFTPKTLVKIGLYLPILAVAHMNLLDVARRSVEGDIEIDSFYDWLTRAAVVLLGVCLIGAASMLSMLGIMLVLGALAGRSNLLSPDASTALAFFIAFWLAPTLAGLIGRKLGIASNSPLRRTIETIDVEDARMGQPEVICTLASEPGYRRKESMAFYPTLANAGSFKVATDILLQSAALPEIFPLRAVYEGEYVDGGVADNTPILGVANVPTKMLIVVYLDHRMERVFDRYRKWGFGVFFLNGQALWSRSSALKAREAPRLAKIATRRGEDWEVFRSWFYGLELVPIIPRASLGNFITGTLNFTTKKANALMAMGYEDTLRQLKRWCLEEPLPLPTQRGHARPPEERAP